MIKQPSLLLRSFWILGFFAAVSTLATGCSGLGFSTVEKTESQSNPLSAASAISARTTNGTITVEPAIGPDLKVDATIRARTEERLQATNLEIGEASNGTVQISIAWPDGEPLSGEGADLKIRVPSASDIQLSTTNGTIRVEGFDAAIQASTTNGTVTIIGPAREVNITTTNGSVHLEEIVGSIRARSTNGRITALLNPDNPGPVNLTSTNGSITLRVGAAFVGSVSARTSNGQISLRDFPVSDAPVTLKQERRTAQFDFGGNGGDSSLATTNGNVTIAPLEP